MKNIQTGKSTILKWSNYKFNQDITFPLNLQPEDLEEFETLDDVRVAVVYCIDLSSTMKYSVGKYYGHILLENSTFMKKIRIE